MIKESKIKNKKNGTRSRTDLETWNVWRYITKQKEK